MKTLVNSYKINFIKSATVFGNKGLVCLKLNTLVTREVDHLY